MLQSGLPFLATMGPTAPIVGLFGAVWGIMRSFTGVAAAKDASLASHPTAFRKRERRLSLQTSNP